MIGSGQCPYNTSLCQICALWCDFGQIVWPEQAI
jgi:hypothetical protein